MEILLNVVTMIALIPYIRKDKISGFGVLMVVLLTHILLNAESIFQDKEPWEIWVYIVIMLVSSAHLIYKELTK